MSIANIIGKWPGDETDEEIQKGFDAMDPVKRLKAENARLADLLRWRSTETEPPTDDGTYQTLHYFPNGEWGIRDLWFRVPIEGEDLPGWEATSDYWRPIGDLPPRVLIDVDGRI